MRQPAISPPKHLRIVKIIVKNEPFPAENSTIVPIMDLAIIIQPPTYRAKINPIQKIPRVILLFTLLLLFFLLCVDSFSLFFFLLICHFSHNAFKFCHFACDSHNRNPPLKYYICIAAVRTLGVEPSLNLARAYGL